MSNCPIYDAAVIGAGVMGSATAYYLSKSTKNIILIEQFDFLHRKGSSHGESRIIRMTYPQDHYTELMQPAYKLWAEIESKSGSKVFTKTGGLDFGRPNNPQLISLIKAAQKYSVRHEVLKPEELSRRFPTIHIPQDYIAVYSPSSGILNATKAVATLQTLAKANGCRMKDNCKVVKISKDTFYTELRTSTGEIIRARKCIFTSGAWTNKILKENFGIDLPLKPEQTTIAYWKVDKPEAYSSKSFPVFINYEDPLIYGTPALEYPGLIKCSVHFGKEVDPDKRDFEPGHEALINEVGPFLLNFFQGVNPSPVMTESCMYVWTPEGDFIIDKVPNSEGLFLGCGFSGHGFKLAPVVGQMLADLALKGVCTYPRAQKFFSLERFKLKNVCNYKESKL